MHSSLHVLSGDDPRCGFDDFPLVAAPAEKVELSSNLQLALSLRWPQGNVFYLAIVGLWASQGKNVGKTVSG